MIDELSDLLDAADAVTASPIPANVEALREALSAFRDELRICADERVSEGGASSLAETTQALLLSVAPRLAHDLGAPHE
jgi:hypothetical protein